MNLDMVIGLLAGIGLYTGVRIFVEVSKKSGVVQLIMTFIPPVSTSLWCMKKSSFSFDGSDWNFLVHTATVEKLFEPWIILILYGVMIGLTVLNIVKIRKRKK